MKKRWLLLKAFMISFIFTILDGIVHYSFEALEIYSYPIHFLGIQSPLINYAISKLISSTVLLFILLYLFSKTGLNSHAKYNLIAIIIVILLEVRYIISGSYTAKWHILNLINHYLTLLIGMYIIDQIKFKD